MTTTWYNVYSNGLVAVFSSREEADQRATFWEQVGPAANHVRRYGCYPEDVFIKLKKERDELLTLYKEYEKADELDGRTRSALWTAYSRFWWDNRDKI